MWRGPLAYGQATAARMFRDMTPAYGPPPGRFALAVSPCRYPGISERVGTME
jgi:hypothetical protein